MIVGTSLLGQTAIDHFVEAMRKAATYMNSKDFQAFTLLCKGLVDGAWDDGKKETEEDVTVKAEAEQSTEKKKTYAEKLKEVGAAPETGKAKVRIPRAGVS